MASSFYGLQNPVGGNATRQQALFYASFKSQDYF